MASRRSGLTRIPGYAPLLLNPCVIQQSRISYAARLRKAPLSSPNIPGENSLARPCRLAHASTAMRNGCLRMAALLRGLLESFCGCPERSRVNAVRMQRKHRLVFA